MSLAEAGPWLLVPLVLTTVAGQWDGAPVLPWLVVALARGLMTAFTFGMTVGGWKGSLALERTVSDEQELRQLFASMHRWYRLRVSATVAIVVVLIGLVTLAAVSPAGSIRGLPIGSAAVLAMILYDTGQAAFMAVLFVAWAPQRSQLTYRLPWHSPLESQPVRDFLRGVARDEFGRGMWVTTLVVSTVVLLGLGSPLVVPAAGFITAVGYVTVIAEGISVRVMVQRIARRLKEAQMASLRERIDGSGPQLAALGESELAQVKGLAELYDLIRNSPTRVGVMGTLTRATVSLVVPTLTFVAAVVGEKYLGQLLDEVFP
jgi:hypothetical protein